MTVNHPSNWPDPNLDFLADAPTQPRMPLQAFGQAAAYLEEIEEKSDLIVDYVASGLLALVAASIGKTFSLKVTRERFEPLIVWSIMLGAPGTGKTPSAAPIKSAIFSKERELVEMFAEHALASQTDEADEEADAILVRAPRYMVQNATIEALSEIESVSPYGLLLEYDELSGLVENLSRYSAGNDLHYYLEAWQPGPYRTDRIARGATIIDNHLFGIWGGMQPDVLRNLLSDDATDQGLLARFLIFNPRLRRPGALRAGMDHSTLLQASEKLAGWNDGKIDEIDRTELHLSRDALNAFNQWRCTSYADRYGAEGKRGSALAKMESQLLRIAGTLHMINWAFSAEADLELVVSAETMRNAILLVEDYFVLQIELVYSLAGIDPVERMAIQMLKVICRGRLAEFRPRDAYRRWKLRGASAKSGKDRMKKACQFMLEHHLIRKAAKARGDLYAVNPALLDEALHHYRLIMLAR